MSNNDNNLYELVSLVERGSNRKKILEILNGDDVYMPSELAEEADIYRQNVSRVISVLEENDLINCLVPNAQKHRYYEITEQGKEVLKVVKDRGK